MVEPTEPAPAAARRAREGGLCRVLRLPGASVEQFAQWLPLAWHSAKALTPTDVQSADFTKGTLVGTVRLDERWLSLWFDGHVGAPSGGS